MRLPLVVSVAVFAGALALRLLADMPQGKGILLLLTAPILLMSLAYGPRVGTGFAAAAIAAFLVCQMIDGVFDAVSVGTRAFTYFAIPLTIWLARKDADRRSTPGAAEAIGRARRGRPETGAEALTQREREVLALVAAGHTSAEIAAMLVLSVRTIESHRAGIRRKLGQPSPPELARQAQRWGVLPSNYPAVAQVR